MVKRYTITWRGERGAYFVSEPNWDGGEVVMASDYDALEAHLNERSAQLIEALRAQSDTEARL